MSPLIEQISRSISQNFKKSSCHLTSKSDMTLSLTVCEKHWMCYAIFLVKLANIRQQDFLP